MSWTMASQLKVTAVKRLAMMLLVVLMLAGCSDDLPGPSESDAGTVIDATLGFGETYTFTDGVQVSVDEPRRRVQGHEAWVYVKYTITNGSNSLLTRSEDLLPISHAWADVDGSSAPLHGGSGEPRNFPNVIEPGDDGFGEAIYEAASGSEMTTGWNYNGETAIFKGIIP